MKGLQEGADATSGTFTINTGGLVDIGDGTATFNPSEAAIAANETREGNQSAHQITYTFSDANGCQNVITRTIFVNPSPTLGINGIVSGGNVCINDEDGTTFSVFGTPTAGIGNFDVDGVLPLLTVAGQAQFNPQNVVDEIVGVGGLTERSRDFDLTYTFTDAVTLCTNTITEVVTIHKLS